jgi:hypothetical protein
LLGNSIVALEGLDQRNDLKAERTKEIEAFIVLFKGLITKLKIENENIKTSLGGDLRVKLTK